MSRDIEVTLKLTTAQFTAASAAAARATGNFTKSVAGAEKSAQGLSRSMGDLYLSSRLVTQGVKTVTRSVGEFIAIGERAASRERTARMFERVSGGALAAEENLDAVMVAMRGTVTEATAMKQAVALLAMELADTPEELALITTQAVMLAREFAGLTSERAVQEFQFTISNQSYRRVDVFGLAIDDVRKRVEKFEDAGKSAEEAFKLGFMEALNDQFNELGGIADDSLTVFEQYKKEFEELGDYLEDQFLPLTTRLVLGLRDVAKLLRGGFHNDITDEVESQLFGAEGAGDYADTVRRLGEAAQVDKTANRYQGTPFGSLTAEDLHDIIIKTASSQEELNAGLAVYRELTGDAIVRTQGLEEKLHDLALAERAAMEAEQEREAGTARAEEMMTAAQTVVDIEKEIAAERAAIIADFRQDAVDEERDRWRDAQLEALRGGFALIDAEGKITKQIAAIKSQYKKATDRAEKSFNDAEARASQQKARQLIEIERAYQRRIADIKEQYEQDEFDATINRDAIALQRARRNRDKQLRDAETTRDDSNRRAEQDYTDALNGAKQARADSIAQAKAAREESLVALEQSIADELEAKRRGEELARQEQLLSLQWQEQDRQIYLNRRLSQVVGEYSAELSAAQSFYSQMAAVERAYRSSRYSSSPSVGRTPRAFASGGYTGDGGMALLHAGEFVLSAPTTRLMEQAVGGALTQQNVTHGPTIQASFTGMGSNDRGWFETRLNDFSRELAGMLS